MDEPGVQYRFGPFEVNSASGELLRNGTPIKLQNQPRQLLLALLESSGKIVSREELRGRLWREDTFVNFDGSLRVAVRKLREALRDNPGDARFIETIPTVGYRFIAPIVEAATLIQETAHAAPLPAPRGPSEAPPAPPHSVISPVWLGCAGACAALVLIAAFVVSVRARVRPGPAPLIQSLAVLPLDNLSGDPGQDYFADGMTDELTTMLAKNTTLRIVSRTSVMQYKGAHRPLPEIARELGVDGILEGSISRSGDKVHMTVQLIQAPSDSHLWAESYDRNSQDLVSLPGEASLAIAKRLDRAVPHPATQRYISPEAHDDYLRGRYLWFHFKNEEAGAYFKKATEIQPDYALGWSGLADYYGQGAIDAEMPPDLSLAPEDTAARKAVELDDSLPDAHLSLAAALVTRQWDLLQADREIARAIQLNPSFAEAYHFRAKLYAALHRDQDAVQAEKKAVELAPFQRPFAMALIYFMVRQYDAAIDDARLKLEASPNDPALHRALREAYRGKGEYPQVVRDIEQAELRRGEDASATATHRAFAQGGYPAVLRLQIASFQNKAATRYTGPFTLALLYAQLGDRNRTLPLLEDAFRQHAPQLLWLQNDPAFDFLHADPRYRTIVRGLGLPPA